MYADPREASRDEPEPSTDAREQSWAVLALVTLLGIILLFGTWVYEVLFWAASTP